MALKKSYRNSRDRIRCTWRNMLNRCEDSNNKDYNHYGNRGITVCDEWHDFDNFYTWSLLNDYTDDLTIDRINVDGNYEPDNCRWSDVFQQRNNMRSNIYITYNNRTLTLKQWSRYLNISYGALRYRYRNHMSIEDMLTSKEKCTVKYVTYDNKTLSVRQWSDIIGISRDVLYHRLKRYGFDMGRVFDNFDDMNYDK